MTQEWISVKPGDKGTCGICNRPVLFTGKYWTHEGETYRHPANPQPPKEEQG